MGDVLWIAFRVDGRDLEWCVEPGPPRRLHVRSRTGDYHVRAEIGDDAFGKIHGRPTASWVRPPLVIGSEYPLGHLDPDAPFQLGGPGAELVPYAIIHTELVRSLVGRWVSRKRYFKRRPGP